MNKLPFDKQDRLFVVEWGKNKYSGIAVCVSGEYCYDYIVRRFGFENQDDYQKSQPGNFFVRTNQGIRVVHTKRGKPYKWMVKEYDNKNRGHFNYGHYGLYESPKLLNIMVRCIQAMQSQTMSLSMSIEQFKQCRHFDSVDEKDLWFCEDWSEK